MQYIFEAKIIRLEGFPDLDQVTCEIRQNNKLQHTLFPFNTPDPVLLNNSGAYQFTFLSNSSIKSISFAMDLFTEDGAQWLPLLETNDFITELPEEVQAPRFLLILFKTHSLEIIEESGLNSEESPRVTENDEYMPEIKLFSMDEYLEGDYQQSFSNIPDLEKSHEFSEAISEISRVEPMEKEWQSENLTFIDYPSKEDNDESKEIPQTFERLIHINCIQGQGVDEYDKNLVQFLNDSKDLLKKNEEREEALLLLINEREAELKVAQGEILRLRNYIHKLENNSGKVKAKETNHSLISHPSACDNVSLQEEVIFLRKALKNEKMKNAGITIAELNMKVAERDSIIVELQKKLSKTRNKINDLETRDSQNCSVALSDELDEAVKLQAKSCGIFEEISKDKEQFYTFRDRKIGMIMKNGNLHCRVGGILKPFREYINSFIVESSFTRPKERKITAEGKIDSEYDIDRFKKTYHKPGPIVGPQTRKKSCNGYKF